MADRREFPRKVKAAIILRSLNVRGNVTCEGCGLVLGKKPYHIDHTIPEGLLADKSRPLMPSDGKLLGWDCCHKPKTASDVRQIRKSDRQRDKIGLGIRKHTSRPIMGSKRTPFKKKLSGEVVLR